MLSLSHPALVLALPLPTLERRFMNAVWCCVALRDQVVLHWISVSHLGLYGYLNTEGDESCLLMSHQESLLRLREIAGEQELLACTGTTLLQLARLAPDGLVPGRQALARLAVHLPVALREPYWPLAVHLALRSLGKTLSEDSASRASAVTALRELMAGTVAGAGFSLTDWLARLDVAAEPAAFRGEHQLYQPGDLQRARQQHGQREEAYGEDSSLLPMMAKRGPQRALIKVDPVTLSTCEALADAFPNFRPVVEHYCQAICLAMRTPARILASPPVLLVGPPGCGKSEFARRLAQALQVNSYTIAMMQSEAGWELTGLNPTWRGAQCGRIARALIDSPHANPLIFIDELEKANNSERRRHQADHLLALLEPEDARRFQDEYLGFPMDASRILWLAAANSLEPLSKPLLSRLRVIPVAAPTPEQTRSLLFRLYRQLISQPDYQGIFSSWLSEPVAEALMHLSIREAKRILGIALGAACYRQPHAARVEVTLADINAVRGQTEPRALRGVGFLAEVASAERQADTPQAAHLGVG